MEVSKLTKSVFLCVLVSFATACVSSEEAEPEPEVCTPPNPSKCDPGAELFAAQFGPGNNQAITRLGRAPDGGAVIGGDFYVSMDGAGDLMESAGDTDSFVLRVDEQGTPMWSARQGTWRHESIRAVKVASTGETYVVGKATDVQNVGYIYATVYSGAGEELWSAQFGENLFDARVAADVASNGDLIIVITFDHGTLSFGGERFEVKQGFGAGRLAYGRLSRTGDHVASHIFSGLAADVGIAVDRAGNTHLATTFALSLDFGGATTALSGPGSPTTTALAKLGPEGQPVWARTLSAPSDGEVVASLIALTDAGESVVFGRYRGAVADLGAQPLPAIEGEGFVLVTLDGGGNTLSASGFGDHVFADARSVGIDDAGDILLAGISADEPGTSDTDGFIKKVGASGAALWSREYGGPGRQVVAAAMTTADAIFIGGSFTETISLASGDQLSATDLDGFVIKLAP